MILLADLKAEALRLAKTYSYDFGDPELLPPLHAVPVDEVLALIQAVEAARVADAVLFEHMHEWYSDSEWPELPALRAALACFEDASGDAA